MCIRGALAQSNSLETPLQIRGASVTYHLPKGRFGGCIGDAYLHQPDGPDAGGDVGFPDLQCTIDLASSSSMVLLCCDVKSE
jgi:hypothetical protein